ncbi:carbohydrate binding family 9 domain-containing protein [Pelomonas cellulosilytica]|uniref:Carbohydrate binding family 9 domain-containing protein n=1 Tax=Pelomonas cellulosilytica TaxID=2906762 RepID=A0ABS8XXN2_9BURK|nr:carbohydrate binding family 9 domain-containing protein [Pelomonas sp. P8]MCE4557404.1 carbohydrate binding family 9 domain-containing protein [Pelomonas sp. P8]
MRQRLSGLGLALALALPADAQPASPAQPTALRLAAGDTPPTLDGRLDDAVWRRAPVYDRFVQFLPADKQPARWRTTVQVLATEDALVFGIRAWDPAPERIRAPLARRDQVKADQDYVAVFIDPVGLGRAAQYVRVSAAGSVDDGLFSAEEDADDSAPDFDIEAAAARLPDGYSIELRWPLAALRFPHTGGAPWRVMVTRNIPREDRMLDVSSPALTQDALTFIADLQPLDGLGDLAMDVRERSFVSVHPELTWRRVNELSDNDGRRRAQHTSLGAEIKWRPRADWVVDLTLNPDFSQVEVDEPQLAGNTRFALSVPEKRPFFLESADVVGPTQPDESGENRSLAAFYTRAITDPDWGLRVTWRGAGAEATALHLRDAGGGTVLRAGAFSTRTGWQPRDSEASFARGRLQLGGLGLAALVSLRNFGEGRSTQVIGSDGLWRDGDSDQWRGHLLLSTTTLGLDEDGQARRVGREHGHRAWLGWRHRDANWTANVNVEDIGARFANDNGFVSQSGIRRASAFGALRLGASEFAGLSVHDHEAQLRLQETRTKADPLLGVAAGRVVDRLVQPGFWFAAARNTGVWGHVGLDRHRARDGAPLHATRTLLLGFESNPGELLNFVTAEVEWGRRLDVDADRVGPGAQGQLQAQMRLPLPRWAGAGRWLEIDLRLGVGWVDAPDGHRAFTDRSAQSLFVLHLSAHDSLRLIRQQTRFSRRMDAASGLMALEERGRLLSLMAQHRVGLARVIGLGLNRGHAQPGSVRSSELFVKVRVGY